MSHRITGVILDWAGTAIDFGSFAPVIPFIDSFKQHGIDISLQECRIPMGLKKIDHVKYLLNSPNIKEQFFNKYHRYSNETDITNIYRSFNESIFYTLKDHAEPIDGVVETVEQLRAMNIKIGSTSGYTKEMIKIIAPIAEAYGYYPDYVIGSDEVSKCRPYPYMIYKNIVNLDLVNSNNVIKVGDTITDIYEGLNAKCISVGVVVGGNELGLNKQQFATLGPKEKKEQITTIKEKMLNAGAHYVIETIHELPELIQQINLKLEDTKLIKL